MSFDAALPARVANRARAGGRVTRRLAWGLLALGALAFVAPLVLRPGPLVNAGGSGLAGRFLTAALHPALDTASLALAGRAAWRTLEYAVCGSVLSVLIGVPLGVLSSGVFWRHVAAREPGRAWLSGWPRGVVRAAAAVPRAVHEVVWALLLVGVLGLTPMSAVLALGLPFGLITARVFADILDDTPLQPMQALRDAGVGPTAALAYGLLPQAAPQLVAYALYRLECGLRSAVILGLVGAGGLGFEIHLSLQSLRYEEVWLFLYALAALVAAVDGWSALLNRRLQVTVRAGAVRVRAGAPGVASGGRVLRFSLAGFAVLALVSFAGVELHEAFARGTSSATWLRLAELARASWPPRLERGDAAALFALSVETLRMSVFAIVVAALGGWLVSFPAAASLVPRDGAARRPACALLLATRGALTLARAFSEGVWALALLFVLFPGELPGALALGLYNAAVLARLMAHVYDSADLRALHALRDQGAALPCAVAYALVPQSLTRCAGYVFYRWEVCVRATAVVGVVGAGGLGRRLEERLAAFDYPGVAAALLFYVALTLGVDACSAAARRALRRA